MILILILHLDKWKDIVRPPPDLTRQGCLLCQKHANALWLAGCQGGLKLVVDLELRLLFVWTTFTCRQDTPLPRSERKSTRGEGGALSKAPCIY